MHIISDSSFQPYGFLLAGGSRRRSSAASSSDDGSTGLQTPLQPPFDASFNTVLAATEHGKFLGGHLDFVVPPHINPVEGASELPVGDHCLFVGHLKFETSTGDVRWLIKRLCGVTALRVETKGNGCCVVHLATAAEEAAVRALNDRVLFDHDGVWYARDAVAVALLKDYVEKVLPRLSGKYGRQRPSLRLPRDTLVVEESRAMKKSRKLSAGSLFASIKAAATRSSTQFQHGAPPPYAAPTAAFDAKTPPPPPPPYSKAF